MSELVSFRLPAALSAPSEGRTRLSREIVDILAGHGNAAEVERVSNDMELIASELLTNAVRAGAEWIDVRLESRPDGLRLIVRDDAGGAPAPRHAGQQDVNGRGLAIVAAVAATWGVDRAAAHGKAVWADVRIAGGAGRAQA